MGANFWGFIVETYKSRIQTISVPFNHRFFNNARLNGIKFLLHLCFAFVLITLIPGFFPSIYRTVPFENFFVFFSIFFVFYRKEPFFISAVFIVQMSFLFFLTNKKTHTFYIKYKDLFNFSFRLFTLCTPICENALLVLLRDTLEKISDDNLLSLHQHKNGLE